MTENEKIESIQHHLARKHRIWPADRHWIHAEFLLTMHEMRPTGTSKRPPWQHGRHKTRGGRDQDRWRKRHSTVKIMRERRNLRYRNIEDYCRANGIEFRRFVPDLCEWLDGTLHLKDNPDCDFVKGGES